MGNCINKKIKNESKIQMKILIDSLINNDFDALKIILTIRSKNDVFLYKHLSFYHYLVIHCLYKKPEDITRLINIIKPFVYKLGNLDYKTKCCYKYIHFGKNIELTDANYFIKNNDFVYKINCFQVYDISPMMLALEIKQDKDIYEKHAEGLNMIIKFLYRLQTNEFIENEDELFL